MEPFRVKLSDDPKDLEGALEWVQAEIDKEEKQSKDTEKLMGHMQPFIIEIAQKKGVLTTQ